LFSISYKNFPPFGILKIRRTNVCKKGINSCAQAKGVDNGLAHLKRIQMMRSRAVSGKAMTG
jgi:hypothetical protein